MNHSDTLLYKLRFLFVGALIIVVLFLAAILFTTLETGSAEAQASSTADVQIVDAPSDDPNVVTTGMTLAVDRFGKNMTAAAHTIHEDTQSASAATARTSKLIARRAGSGVVAVARGVAKGLGFVGNAAFRSAALVFGAPGKLLKFVSNTSVVSAVIRPSDHVEVPIIDPNSPELQAAIAALPPAPAVLPAAPTAGPQWPIQGAVTTAFGVAHWPYQRTHTGLDISDGQRSGVTPIKPFRPGRVIDTIRSYQGLGNHVVVDHGNGVTSVYAHLASIAVQIGQEVNLDTTLGFEGSTGASTGTHLHFEIRVNGQAADPRQFVSGQP
ncbi:MAG TPA: M23 family metallopeptidase [Verrucomicrobiae bacterium]|nr:M23 family metallopeptidase [Verrucomicrobiae bacterium]